MRWSSLAVLAASLAGAAAAVLSLGPARAGYEAAECPTPAMAVRSAPAAAFGLAEGTASAPIDRTWTPQRAARLGRGGDGANAGELWQLALGAENPMVAGNAVRALGRLGELRNDARLDALLRDVRSRVRQEAVLALGRSRDPLVVQQLADLLPSADASMRPLVIRALGELGGERARSFVAAVLADPMSTAAEVALARQAVQSIDSAGRLRAPGTAAR